MDILESISLVSPHMKPISREAFVALRKVTPKRIRIKDRNVLNIMDKGKYKAFLNVPFRESVEPLLKSEVPGFFLVVKDGKNPWFGIGDDDKLSIIEKFCIDHDKTVFIRSLLSCMVALDMNFEGDDEVTYTELGRHEHAAKEEQSVASRSHISNLVKKFVSSLRFYRDSDGIVAVPPSSDKSFCLPRILAKSLSSELDIENYSDSFMFESKVKSLQNERVGNKWDILENSGFCFDKLIGHQVKGKKIILLDDLYQSGTTIHYIAMHLQQLGARELLGISIVKSRRDNDNLS